MSYKLFVDPNKETERIRNELYHSGIAGVWSWVCGDCDVTDHRSRYHTTAMFIGHHWLSADGNIR